MCRISKSFKQALKAVTNKVVKITTKDYNTAKATLLWVKEAIVPNLRGYDLLCLKDLARQLVNAIVVQSESNSKEVTDNGNKEF